MNKSKIFNCILACTLILSLVLSIFVISPMVISATADADVWNGEKATDFAAGRGTEGDPFLIENGAQLYKMVAEYSNAATASGSVNTATYFKLTKDIYLNTVTAEDLRNPSVTEWTEKFNNWYTVSGTANGFCGDFDGNGYTIYGLFANGGFAGLIPILADGGNIHNVNLKNSFIYSAQNGGSSGGIVGYVYSYWKLSPVTVSNCSVDNIVVNGSSARVGGIVGGFYNLKVTVTNCSVTNASLKSDYESYPDYVSGLVGYGGSDTVVSVVKNCYTDSSVHPVNATTNKTNFDIIDDKITYTNVYTSATNNFEADEGVTYLTEAQMKGEAAKENMSGFDFKWTWETTENSYPVLKPDIVEVWNGKTSATFAGGSGTADDPYQIEKASQLAYVVSTDLTNGLYFKLVKDIRINDTTSANWKENALDWVWGNIRFVGNFDGDGHTIDGLFYDEAKDKFGLFSYVGDSEIKNIKITNAYINNQEDNGVGILVGQTSADTVFEGIYIDESCVLYAPNAAGVAGITPYSYKDNTNYSDVTITNSAVLATITGGSYVGAFVGKYAYGNEIIKINNSFNASNVAMTPNRALTNSKNNYTLIADTASDAVVLTSDQMKGKNAVTNMPGLHFGRHWKVVENGYPVPMVYNVPKYVWNGTAATSFASGSGTEQDPYIIENAEQLYYLTSEVSKASNKDFTNGKHFKITKDIYINDVADGTPVQNLDNPKSWGNGLLAPNTDDDNFFYGTLDGGGHVIYGLYTYNYVNPGLFGAIANGAVVKNLGFDNLYFEGGNGSAGAIAGYANYAGLSTSNIAKIQNCYVVNGKMVAGSSSVLANAGGFIGNASDATIEISNCYVYGVEFSASTCNASMIGKKVKATVKVYNSYFIGKFPVTNTGDGHNYVKYYNVYTDQDILTKTSTDADEVIAKLTTDQMKGEAAKENMSGLDFYCIWETVENGYPILREDILEAWGGAPADITVIDYAGGNGTKASPYKIENGDQLYKMVAENSNADVLVAPETQTYFEIIADINLGGKQWYKSSVSNWLSNEAYNTIGFNGIVYGNGHKIYNLYSETTAGAIGLIPVATQLAEIHDLHLIGGNLIRYYPSYAAGGLIGLAKAQAGSKPITVKGCSVEDMNISGTNGAGGLIGYVYSQSVNIIDSYVVNSNISVTATSAAKAAAFIGYFDGSAVNNTFVIEKSYCDNIEPLPYMNETFKAATTFNNVYTTLETYDDSISGLKKVTAVEITGDTAKENLNGFNFNQVWQTVDGKYPVHISFEKKAKLWDGTVADGFAGGEGTLEAPYLISNASQLLLLANADTSATKGNYYKLTNDISISDTSYNNWQLDNPYGWTKKTAYLDGYTYGNSFAGVLDGAGYTVSGLFISDEITNGGSYAYGLIPFVTADAVIKNINIDGVYANVTGDAYVGAVAGAAHLDEADTANSLKMAQFVGAKVSNCDITANNKGDILGGGSKNAKIELCGADDLYTDDVIIYNSVNIDETALVNISRRILGTLNNYITDINAVEDFDIRDLVYAYEGIQANANIDTESYNLVWSQEFDGNELDYSVWSQNTTMSKKSNLIYADNSTVADNILKLECKDTGDDDTNGDNIYSVNYGLSTLDTMSFKYGRLEMRAKIPFGAGAFPSLWLTSRNAIGNAAINPYDAEIDIFEVFGKTDSQNKMVTCIHKWYNDETGARTGDECSCGTGNGDGNAYKIEEIDRSYEVLGSTKEDWHTIVFEWTEDAMTFSVDGKVYYTADKSDMDNASALFGTITGFDLSGYNTDNEGLFNQFMYLRLNNHMYTPGGSIYVYGGLADEIDASKLNYEIDYIRLYQKNDGKSQINLK